MRAARRVELLGVAFLLSLSGCSVRWIAPYDSTLDSRMTEVQADTEAFLIRLGDGGETAGYAANREFYARQEGALRTLLLRAQAEPKGNLVADQIGNLERTFELMETTHRRDGTLNRANLAGERDTLESELRSFFALELALKNHGGRHAASSGGAAIQQGSTG